MGRGDAFVLNSSLKIPDRFLLPENPRAFLLLRTPDVLSVCPGIDSQYLSWPRG